ncbi:MAG: hypothetical protein ABI682_05400 [Acidobacteriota bacterium]
MIVQLLLASAVAVMALVRSPPLFELRAESVPNAPGARSWLLAGKGGAPETIFLHPEVLLDASAIASADVERGMHGSSQIRTKLTPEGARRLADVTGRLVGRRIGIIVDGRLRAAVSVRDRVSDGILLVAGNFSDSELEELARRLGPPSAKMPAVESGAAGRQSRAVESARGTSPVSELEGAWKVMNITINGGLGYSDSVGSTWTFRGGELTIESGSHTARFAVRTESGAPGAFRVDPIAPSNEHGGWMIFAREGDRLTLAMSDGLAGRPQNFTPESNKIVMRLTRANRSIEAATPCSILEAAGVVKLLPGGASAAPHGQSAATSCAFSDPAGRGDVTLTVIRAAGRSAYEKEVEKIRRKSSGMARDDPEFGIPAMSARQGYRVVHLVLKGETLVAVIYQLPGTDDARLREFTKRLLDLIRD